jgi:thiol-disulfide isomerase/thioredoxin
MRHYSRLCAIVLASGVMAVPLLAQTEGKAAPAFTLKTLGGSVDSLAHYAGHPVLINFWATWCKPCRAEMPYIIDAFHKHAQDGLSIITINLTDQEGSTKEVMKFVNEFQLPSPVLLDQKGKVRKLYKLHAVPTSIFVGADGLVHSVNQGPIGEEALRHQLSDILPEP